MRRPTRAINQIHGDIAKNGDAPIADILDKSEYDDGSDRRNSTRNQRADIASLAAIKRSVMLKDFLKLVEYKIKR